MLDIVVYFTATWVFAWLFYTITDARVKFFMLIAWLGMVALGFGVVYSLVYTANPTLTSTPSPAEKAEVIRYVVAYIASIITTAIPVFMGLYEWITRGYEEMW